MGFERKGTRIVEAESSRKNTYKSGITPSHVFLLLVAGVLIAGAAFYGGVSYEKSHLKTVSSKQTTGGPGSGGYGGRGGFGGGDRVMGQVTAISPTSITVQNERTGTSSTLAITSSTQITNNGQTATASDIQSGDTVFITENTSNTSQAARILLNPSFGGGGNQNQSNSASGSATTD
jgi:hypothetical protein